MSPADQASSSRIGNAPAAGGLGTQHQAKGYTVVFVQEETL